VAFRICDPNGKGGRTPDVQSVHRGKYLTKIMGYRQRVADQPLRIEVQ
jgi:hypothetical protein